MKNTRTTRIYSHLFKLATNKSISISLSLDGYSQEVLTTRLQPYVFSHKICMVFNIASNEINTLLFTLCILLSREERIEFGYSLIDYFFIKYSVSFASLQILAFPKQVTLIQAQRKYRASIPIIYIHYIATFQRNLPAFCIQELYNMGVN